MEEPKSLDSLFKEKLFRIPDYQRGYAWQPEQLKDFWEDLMNLSDNGSRKHYTGVLTLKQVPAAEIQKEDPEHFLTEDYNYDLYHVVDGQQRLTTFVVFLQAFIEFVRALPENNRKSDAKIFITGPLHLAEVQKGSCSKLIRQVISTGPTSPATRLIIRATSICVTESLTKRVAVPYRRLSTRSTSPTPRNSFRGNSASFTSNNILPV